MPRSIPINRASVLTLWAAVVAERLGFDWAEALTLGRAGHKGIVAEFIYGGKVTPTWPMNPSRDTRFGW